MGRATQRHSLPQPVGTQQHDELVPRPKSFLFKPQQNTRDKFESTSLRGLSGALQAFGIPDVNSTRANGWRDSARSVTSSGCASVTTVSESHPRWGNWRSSDQLSLSSNTSSSSAFTRFSSSTASTSLTASSSGTMSARSSRSSLPQKDKRFSNIKRELYANYCWIRALNTGTISVGWGPMGIR